MLVNLIKLETHEINTAYAIDEFANCQNEDEDIDINTIHSGYQNGLIPISTLYKLIKRIKKQGVATHIDIDYNDDHNEYEINSFKIEIASKESSELFHREKNEENDRRRRINELETELHKLRNEQKVDDLPF
jgi:hypothetical protein